MNEKESSNVTAPDWGSLILAMATAIIVSVAITYFVFFPQAQPRDEPVAVANLPILSVNLGEIVAAYSDIKDNAQRREKMERVAQKFRDLREAGFIILDANAVITAPDEIILSKDLFLNDEGQ